MGGGITAAPLSSAELFVVVDVPKKSTDTPANVPLRGVQPAAFHTRPDLKITAGRTFEWGKNEIKITAMAGPNSAIVYQVQAPGDLYVEAPKGDPGARFCGVPPPPF